MKKKTTENNKQETWFLIPFTALLVIGLVMILYDGYGSLQNITKENESLFIKLKSQSNLVCLDADVWQDTISCKQQEVWLTVERSAVEYYTPVNIVENEPQPILIAQKAEERQEGN